MASVPAGNWGDHLAIVKYRVFSRALEASWLHMALEMGSGNLGLTIGLKCLRLGYYDAQMTPLTINTLLLLHITYISSC